MNNRIMHIVHFVTIKVILMTSFGGLDAYSFGQYRLLANLLRPLRQECVDVAIVGGGISGTYTGWRLRNQGWRIALFENTDRIGGRMFSVFLPSVPNVPADLGAMRYIPGAHTTLESLFTQLGLQSKVFQPDQFEKVYYFRGTRMTSQELNSPKLPYNLAPGESRNEKELRWSLSQRALNVSEPDKIPDVEEFLTPEGIPLYKEGFLHRMGKVWSNEAKEYLKHLDSFWSLYDPKANSVHHVIASNPASPGTGIRTVDGGMNSVSQRLAGQFVAASNRNTIHLNRRVDSVQKVWNGVKYIYRLTVYETETVGGFTRDKRVRAHTVCANDVILAIPSRALKNLRWYPLQNHPTIQRALNAVTEHIAMKVFLAYPNPWWDNLPVNNKAFLTDLPVRQGGEFGRFRNSLGQETAMMMVSYADEKDTNEYWRELRMFGNSISSSAVPAAFSVSSNLVEQVHRQLATIYGISASSIPAPLDGVMHMWDDPLNGKAWHFVKPGYKPKDVEAFMRQPSPTDRVFVVTNAFSRVYFGWAEGCLRSADDVLMKYFNIT